MPIRSRAATPGARALILVALVLVACGGVEREDVSGVYVMRKDGLADTLWLDEGGRYRRVSVLDSGERSTASGAWSTDGRGAGWALVLDAPDSLSEGAHMIPLPPRIKPLRPLRGEREVRLPVDETTGYVYQQISR